MSIAKSTPLNVIPAKAGSALQQPKGWSSSDFGFQSCWLNPIKEQNQTLDDQPFGCCKALPAFTGITDWQSRALRAQANPSFQRERRLIYDHARAHG
ncbi:MAG: hypothetical protein LH470_06655 [Lysobacter sp.]|nr:hypothetical protein [Lysobacter sp.]